MAQALSQSLTQLVLQTTQLEEKLRTFQSRCAQLELAEDNITLLTKFIKDSLQYLPEAMQEEGAALLASTPETIKTKLQELRTLQVAPQEVKEVIVEESSFQPRRAGARKDEQ